MKSLKITPDHRISQTNQNDLPTQDLTINKNKNKTSDNTNTSTQRKQSQESIQSSSDLRWCYLGTKLTEFLEQKTRDQSTCYTISIYFGVILGLLILMPLFILAVFFYIVLAHLVVLSLVNIILNVWRIRRLFDLCEILKQQAHDPLKFGLTLICGLIFSIVIFTPLTLFYIIYVISTSALFLPFNKIMHYDVKCIMNLKEPTIFRCSRVRVIRYENERIIKVENPVCDCPLFQQCSECRKLLTWFWFEEEEDERRNWIKIYA